MQGNSHVFHSASAQASQSKQRALAASDSSFFDIAPAPFLIISYEGVILRANRATGELLGVTEADLLGRPFVDFVHHAEESPLAAFSAEQLADVASAECELYMVRQTGKLFEAAVSCKRIEHPGLPVGLLLVVRELSSDKESNQSLQRLNERMKHAVQAVRDGIWDWDIKSGEVFFSPQWARLLGYAPEEVPQRVEFFFSILHPDDVQRVSMSLREYLEGRTAIKQDEIRLRSKSGEYRWFFDRGAVVKRDSLGKPLRMVGTITDITQRRQTQESLRQSETQTRLLVEAASLGLWDWDLVTNEVYFSVEWKAQLGYQDHELKNGYDEWQSRLHPDDLARALAAVEEFRNGRIAKFDLEFRLRHRDGSWRWIFARADVLRDLQGNPVRMMGCHLDITDRKEAERANNLTLSVMRATLESTADGILVVDRDGKFKICNNAFCRMYATSLETLAGAPELVVLNLVSEQLVAPNAFVEKHNYLHQNPEETSLDSMYLRDGRVFEHYSCPQMIDGQVVGRVWSFRDVTERKLAEAAQQEALGRLQKIASRLKGVVYQYRLRPDGSYCFPYVSDGLRELTYGDVEEFQKTGKVNFKLIDKKSVTDAVMHSAKNLTPWIDEFQILRVDGALRWLAVNSVPEREPDGSTIWYGFVSDITERKEHDARLRESELRLREAQAISQTGNFHFDARTQVITWSDELYRLNELDRETFTPTFEAYINSIHPEDRQRVTAVLQQLMVNPGRFDHDYRLPIGSGIRWVRTRGVALVDADGNFIGLEGTCQDITEQKRNEAVTASLETQLRESQKMEAIGTLAGGIAHDFNNILATILGNVEIALLDTSSVPAEVERSLLAIRKAGERARELVKQILSFGRRQPTLRTPISLAPVIAEVETLLSATLPAWLTLDIQCLEDIPCVLADGTQIEQVLLNLVTNSMQAMQGQRGTISIRLDTVELDEQLVETHRRLKTLRAQSDRPVVRITIRDAGPGMSAEMLSRIFEPFFTTKPVGQGTGLGLSVVHGIVQGHDGVVTVDSQLGQGTTFVIYLPPANPGDQPLCLAAPVTELPKLEPTQSRHILYLDDEPAVREVAGQLFAKHGYRITCFDNCRAALEAIRNHPFDFDLVITDYSMPEMDGLEVARAIRTTRDDLPIIVTSGFMDAELTANASRDGVQELIGKPFPLNELFAAVQRLTQPCSEQDVSGPFQ